MERWNKNKSKDGKTYWVYAIITPILINNEIQGFTAIRNNITDKKIYWTTFNHWWINKTI